MIPDHTRGHCSDDRLALLWTVHQHAAWPAEIGPHEGELMMIDTVITGCLTYYFEEVDGLDTQRIDILRDSLTQLEDLLPEIPDTALEYFSRTRDLATLLLNRHSLS
ncbi:MAG: hypothetical protein D6690_13275 [Nitrospirae bacterium]|nr:MAG: hypothetical protein D6690_13275 [Nitrospirota bacterium]